MPKEYDLGTRIQALTLHSEGYPRKTIIEKTGYTSGGLSYLITTAKRRGYKPGDGAILREYVDNEAGRGRKPILRDAHRRIIVEILTTDEASLKLSTQQLADKFNETNEEDLHISRKIVASLLDEEGFQKVNGVWQSKTKSLINKDE
ncbi:hypothetical protein GGR51DRAFT_214223 [Nemania sp. FL0031]|nr:hypothetical protein GGR51DRAFT_214223 [Nemania sp. FL0031]